MPQLRGQGNKEEGGGPSYTLTGPINDRGQWSEVEDLVDHPPHYNQGGIECIDAILAALGEQGGRDYLSGNVIKYVWRYKHKHDELQDIDKALWYLNKLREGINANLPSEL